MNTMGFKTNDSIYIKLWHPILGHVYSRVTSVLYLKLLIRVFWYFEINKFMTISRVLQMQDKTIHQ